MSESERVPTADDPPGDPWEDLAEDRDTLEMLIEEDTPFADRAERLLARLDEDGDSDGDSNASGESEVDR